MRTRTVFLLVVLGWSALGPARASAQDLTAAFTEGETETEVTEAPSGVGTETGIVPAVESPPAEEDAADAPWTQRFLAPGILVLGIVGLVVSLLYYGLRIRSRYEVVD